MRLKAKFSFVVLLSLVSAVPALSEVFKGSPSRVAGSSMVIRWETADESGAQTFEVYRREFRSGGMGPAEKVGEIAARGTSSLYQMEDVGIFKSADRILEYEVRAVDRQGVVIEAVKMTTVFSTGLTSAARRTWGSIKAMFR